jgi:serine phosphatase RsbU (regulator of sigma subunit)
MEQERYERELRLAQEIQQRLLPDRLPEVCGFQLSAYSSPAFEVGGDYYEAVTLKNGNACVLVGDVSGKGISAALYMSVVKGIVLAVGRESNSPKELLERINEGIFGEIDRQSYITAIAVEIDATNSVLRVARAGHTPLAVRQKGKVSLITPKGFGIGLVKSSTFNAVLEQVDVPVTTDDACLLFTDGVNEATNQAGEEFGMENVLEILSHNYEHSQPLTGELLRSLLQFSGGIAQHDDLTFVAIVCRDGGNEAGASVAGRQKYRR